MLFDELGIRIKNQLSNKLTKAKLSADHRYCILIKEFRLFCFPQGLVNSRQPNPVKTWLVNTTLAKNELQTETEMLLWSSV